MRFHIKQSGSLLTNLVTRISKLSIWLLKHLTTSTCQQWLQIIITKSLVRCLPTQHFERSETCWVGMSPPSQTASQSPARAFNPILDSSKSSIQFRIRFPTRPGIRLCRNRFHRSVHSLNPRICYYRLGTSIRFRRYYLTVRVMHHCDWEGASWGGLVVVLCGFAPYVWPVFSSCAMAT